MYCSDDVRRWTMMIILTAFLFACCSDSPFSFVLACINSGSFVIKFTTGPQHFVQLNCADEVRIKVNITFNNNEELNKHCFSSNEEN